MAAENLEDRIDDRRLADARPAGDHQRLRHQRQADRRLLAVGELQATALLNPGDGLLVVDPWPGQPAVGDADHPLGDRSLGPVEARQEGAGSVANLVGDHGSLGSFALEGGQDQFFRRLQQLFGERDQLIRRQPAMTLVHRLGQGVRDPGAQPDHRRLFDAELHRDRIGALETDASNVPCKPIGILGHDLDGVGAVGPKDANCPGGAHPVAVQEDHDFPHDLLLGPGIRDPLGPNRADARHLAQPIRLGLDDVEDLLPEGLDHLLGVDRPDAADHPGAEIFLDPVDRTRCRGLEKPRPELLTVGAIVDPFAGCGDPLAGGDDGGVADHGHQITVSARLCPEHAEAALGVVERDPLNHAGENFLSRGFWRWLHEAPGSPGLSSRATPRMPRGRSRASTDWGSATKINGHSGMSSHREQPPLPTLAGFEFIAKDVASHDGSLATCG